MDVSQRFDLRFTSLMQNSWSHFKIQNKEFVFRQDVGIITEILSYSFKLITPKFWLQEQGLNVFMRWNIFKDLLMINSIINL